MDLDPFQVASGEFVLALGQGLHVIDADSRAAFLAPCDDYIARAKGKTLAGSDQAPVRKRLDMMRMDLDASLQMWETIENGPLKSSLASLLDNPRCVRRMPLAD